MSGRVSERELMLGSTTRIARNNLRAIRVDDNGKLVVDPSVVYVTLQPHFLEKRDTDPSPEVARIYFNTVENRPKVCVAT